MSAKSLNPSGDSLKSDPANLPHKKTGPKGPSKYTTEFLDSLAQKLIAYIDEKLASNRPLFLKEFAYQNNVPSFALSQLIKTHKEFSKAYNKLKDAQEADLAIGGLTSKYDAGFAFRTLKNVSDWRDEQHVKHDGMNNIFNVVIADNVKPKNPANRIFQEQKQIEQDAN